LRPVAFGDGRLRHEGGGNAPIANNPGLAVTRYEDLRRPRANPVLLMSRGREIQYHLPDGPEQERRDETLAAADPLKQIAWLYGEAARPA
jgi:hypothetical protein